MLRKTDFTELDLIRLCEAEVWERVTSAAVKTVKNPFRNTRFLFLLSFIRLDFHFIQKDLCPELDVLVRS